jgi:predicted deacylase
MADHLSVNEKKVFLVKYSSISIIASMVLLISHAPALAAEMLEETSISLWPAIPDYLTPQVIRQTTRNPQPEEPAAVPLILLEASVEPGTFMRLSWQDKQSFAGLEVAVPVLVVHGTKPGPVLCITAAIHGDELNGIEIVRNLVFGIDPASLNGTVIGVPIVNIHGFQRHSRYLPDRRDLNRYFPGNATGSSASRIAHSFFNSIIVHCDALVDLHTGSLLRTNLPQLRADLNSEAIKHMTSGFGATVVLHSPGSEGTLRRAATDYGIPAVTLEAGEPMRFQPDEVSHGVRSIRSLMNHLGMDSRASLWEEPRPIYYQSSWVRADNSGILSSRVTLGETVEKNDLLGTITDPITNLRTEVRSPFYGRILGKALGQAVMPGYALYHIGIEAPQVSVDVCEELEAATLSDCMAPMEGLLADRIELEYEVGAPEAGHEHDDHHDDRAFGHDD